MAAHKLRAIGLFADHAIGCSRRNARSDRVSDNSLKFLRKHFGDAPAMKFINRIHGDYVANRRARVLSDHLTKLIPDKFFMLDVGCGDGLIARLISERRTDVHLRGLDVQVRERTHIPVEPFDGEIIPYDDASFDGVMFVDVLHHTRDPPVTIPCGPS